jgi:hypothetical protein
MSKRPAKTTSGEDTKVEDTEPSLVPQEKNLINVYDVNTVKYTLDTAVVDVCYFRNSFIDQFTDRERHNKTKR